MGRYYSMIIIAAIDPDGIRGDRLGDECQEASVARQDAPVPTSMARSAGRSWWLTHRHPQAASKRPFYARGPIKPD